MRTAKWQNIAGSKNFFIRRHMFNAHEENPRSEHQCEKCNKCFFERHELKKHLENFHEMDDNLICEDCSEEFSIKNDYKEHRKKHENVCVPCGKTYKRQTDKIWHDQSVHQDPSLRTCIRCDRLFANAADLYKHHQKEHPRTRLVILYICSACNDFYFLLSLSYVTTPKIQHRK